MVVPHRCACTAWRLHCYKARHKQARLTGQCAIRLKVENTACFASCARACVPPSIRVEGILGRGNAAIGQTGRIPDGVGHVRRNSGHCRRIAGPSGRPPPLSDNCLLLTLLTVPGASGCQALQSWQLMTANPTPRKSLLTPRSPAVTGRCCSTVITGQPMTLRTRAAALHRTPTGYPTGHRPPDLPGTAGPKTTSSHWDYGAHTRR